MVELTIKMYKKNPKEEKLINLTNEHKRNRMHLQVVNHFCEGNGEAKVIASCSKQCKLYTANLNLKSKLQLNIILSKQQMLIGNKLRGQFVVENYIDNYDL